MNRSFLIILIPAAAVGLGYVLVMRWLGLRITLLPFIMTAILFGIALALVRRHLKRKAQPRSN